MLPRRFDVSGAPFWEAAARHELVLQTCASCGTIRHPPRPMCAVCNSMEYTFEQASGRGRIWSWVVAHPQRSWGETLQDILQW